MKKLLSFITLFLLLLALTGTGYKSAPGCDAGLEKITAYYQNYTQEKLYFRYSVQTIENGRSALPLESELWRDGDHYKLQKEFMIVCQDTRVQVVLLRRPSSSDTPIRVPTADDRFEAGDMMVVAGTEPAVASVTSSWPHFGANARP